MFLKNIKIEKTQQVVIEESSLVPLGLLRMGWAGLAFKAESK